MKQGRWAVIGLLGLYTLMAVLPVLATLAFKLGIYDASAALGGGSASGETDMRALMTVTGAPVLIAWVVMAGLYALGLTMFVRRRTAAWRPLLLAWILDVSVVMLMQGKPAYQAQFSPAEQQFTWTLLMVAAALVASVGVLERARGLSGRAAAA
jgi:hypothetical protein